MEATLFNETSVEFQQATQRYISEDRTLRVHNVNIIEMGKIMFV
jgi:hypothetical protein